MGNTHSGTGLGLAGHKQIWVSGFLPGQVLGATWEIGPDPATMLAHGLSLVTSYEAGPPCPTLPVVFHLDYHAAARAIAHHDMTLLYLARTGPDHQFVCVLDNPRDTRPPLTGPELVRVLETVCSLREGGEDLPPELTWMQADIAREVVAAGAQSWFPNRRGRAVTLLREATSTRRAPS